MTGMELKFVENAHAFKSTVCNVWTALGQSLQDGFAHRPVTTTLKCAGALFITKLAVDSMRYFWKQWGISHSLRSLPRYKGSVPFFGHALSLNVESPWDVLESWTREFKYKAMALDFFGKVSSFPLIPNQSYTWFLIFIFFYVFIPKYIERVNIAVIVAGNEFLSASN